LNICKFGSFMVLMDMAKEREVLKVTHSLSLLKHVL
jgi:hypothetical protein